MVKISSRARNQFCLSRCLSFFDYCEHETLRISDMLPHQPTCLARIASCDCSQDHAMSAPARDSRTITAEPQVTVPPAMSVDRGAPVSRFLLDCPEQVGPLFIAPAMLYVFVLVALPFFLAIYYSASAFTVFRSRDIVLCWANNLCQPSGRI